MTQTMPREQFRAYAQEYARLANISLRDSVVDQVYEEMAEQDIRDIHQGFRALAKDDARFCYGTLLRRVVEARDKRLTREQHSDFVAEGERIRQWRARSLRTCSSPREHCGVCQADPCFVFSREMTGILSQEMGRLTPSGTLRAELKRRGIG